MGLQPVAAATAAAVEGVHGMEPGALLAEAALAHVQRNGVRFQMLGAHLQPPVVRLVNTEVSAAPWNLAATGLANRCRGGNRAALRRTGNLWHLDC